MLRATLKIFLSNKDSAQSTAKLLFGLQNRSLSANSDANHPDWRTEPPNTQQLQLLKSLGYTGPPPKTRGEAVECVKNVPVSKSTLGRLEKAKYSGSAPATQQAAVSVFESMEKPSKKQLAFLCRFGYPRPLSRKEASAMIDAHIANPKRPKPLANPAPYPRLVTPRKPKTPVATSSASAPEGGAVQGARPSSSKTGKPTLTRTSCKTISASAVASPAVASSSASPSSSTTKSAETRSKKTSAAATQASTAKAQLVIEVASGGPDAAAQQSLVTGARRAGARSSTGAADADLAAASRAAEVAAARTTAVEVAPPPSPTQPKRGRGRPSKASLMIQQQQ